MADENKKDNDSRTSRDTGEKRDESGSRDNDRDSVGSSGSGHTQTQYEHWETPSGGHIHQYTKKQRTPLRTTRNTHTVRTGRVTKRSHVRVYTRRATTRRPTRAARTQRGRKRTKKRAAGNDRRAREPSNQQARESSVDSRGSNLSVFS